jgi:hypothetical protein
VHELKAMLRGIFVGILVSRTDTERSIHYGKEDWMGVARALADAGVEFESGEGVKFKLV